MDLLEARSGHFATAKMIANQEQDLLMKAQHLLYFLFIIFYWILCDLGLLVIPLQRLFYNMTCLLEEFSEWDHQCGQVCFAKKTTTANSLFNSTQLFNVGQSDSCTLVPCCPHTWTCVKHSLCSQVEAVRGGVWSETSCSRVSYQQEVKKLLLSACSVP